MLNWSNCNKCEKRTKTRTGYCSKCKPGAMIGVRFFAKVNKNGPLIVDTPCWTWIGSTLPNGYGNFWVHGERIGAHRASYLIANGNLPKNLIVCHHCDNTHCVNPEHLFIGTNEDNARDKVRKGRQRTKRILAVTKEITEMVISLSGAKVKQPEIAAEVGVCLRTVQRIVADNR